MPSENEPENVGDCDAVIRSGARWRTAEEEEAADRIRESFADDVSIIKTEGHDEEKKARSSRSSQALAFGTDTEPHFRAGRNRMDGEILGARSGLGLLYPGRRSNQIQGWQLPRSDCGVSSL